MLVVDSSVWIDLFRNRQTRQTAMFQERQVRRSVLVLDLVLLEVLQGTRTEADGNNAEQRLRRFAVAEGCNTAIAIAAARNYRALRALGVTVRKQVDLLIGTFCIAHGHELLHADRDFEPMELHLGLRVAGGSDLLH
jgi:predicted nucleic acid-binding protein